MDLILHDMTPIHWALAGAVIGGITLLLLYVANVRLGVSTGFENVCALVLRRAAYFKRASLVSGARWRWPFLGGLVLGGALSAALGGGWRPFMGLGLWDTVIAAGDGAKIAWMFAGGLLIGFGTRLAGGCTSGHGIFGIANGERSSFVAVAAFMGAGVVTTNVIYRVLAGGL